MSHPRRRPRTRPPGGSVAAIPTRYAGCHFRSRTEARWAVFFDALEWRWEYEPQGFSLPSGAYLPDFMLHAPGGARWFEVKGGHETGRKADPRWTELVKGTRTAFQAVSGMHRTGDVCARDHSGLLILPGREPVALGHFWSEPGYTRAWDAASGSRFEHGQSGAG